MPIFSPTELAKENIQSVQDYSLLAGRSLSNLFGRPRYYADTLVQADLIGVGSLPIVVLIGFFTGAVLALQTSSTLQQFGSLSLTGKLVALSMVRELGPVLTGILVAGRNSSGMASELGSMKVTEQIDAMESEAVDSHKFLVVTRTLACILALPLLTAAADFSGILFGWIASTVQEPLSFIKFIHQGFNGAGFSDLLPPTFKTAFFGLIVGLVASFQGMRTRGGTEGVGLSATSSVVLCSLFIILSDVILVRVIQVIWP